MTPPPEGLTIAKRDKHLGACQRACFFNCGSTASLSFSSMGSLRWPQKPNNTWKPGTCHYVRRLFLWKHHETSASPRNVLRLFLPSETLRWPAFYNSCASHWLNVFASSCIEREGKGWAGRGLRLPGEWWDGEGMPKPSRTVVGMDKA